MKTDTQIQQDVIAELKWEPSVHGTQIGVQVKDGVVTLTGDVNSYADKCNAGHAAQRVAGVRALAMDMNVNIPGLGRRSDADIAQAAQNILSWSTVLPQGAVKIMVEAGWITLTGDVDWQYQRMSAADALRHVMGATGISNQIAIKPRASAGTVKADIEAALKRRAADDASEIVVEVENGGVTLTGHVHSWAERELATNSAWGTVGVHHVVDRMTLI